MDQIFAGGDGYFKKLGSFMRKCIFRVLSVGAIPNHVAFILDGNRRFATKHNLADKRAGYRAGFLSLMSMLKYCSEMGVQYVSIYAFSIDNFKRQHDEVQYLMDLMLEKLEVLIEEESIINQYGVRICFIGNLKLLNESIRVAAEKVMKDTVNNTKTVILICVAYTSCDEIVHAVQESCKNKNLVEGVEEQQKTAVIKLVDIEKHMYMSIAPDPDILIRTSGEARLSNFLLWQSTNCLLYSPAALWPEIGLRHLVWAVLNYQQHHSYLEKKKKQI